jgi:glycosyltransferase involved in cell wall biosynthesis
MKILVVQDYLRSGGTERQSVLLANGFAAAGHECTLLTFRPGGALDGTVSSKVRRQSLQPFDCGLDWFAPGLNRAVRRAVPDIVLCMGRMANCLAGAIIRSDGPAVIGTMRTGKRLPDWYCKSLQRCRHVVANSEEARHTLIREYAVPAAQISVIYNSLVFPAAGAAEETERVALRATHGAGADTAVLLNVAMFRPEKNQRELIEIVAGLPAGKHWQLWLAGDGPARAECERLVQARGLADRVKLTGFMPDPSPLFAAADLAVHASWSEALSNFLIEAQAHGLPWIACEAQGIRECGRPGETGWVIPRDDRDAFRAALTARMNDPQTVRAQQANAARRFARETFDPARQIGAYLALFAPFRRVSPPAP